MMADDSELLRAYAVKRSQSAFAELVERHLPIVYKSALRQLSGDEHRAKDVAQTVFLALAQQSLTVVGHPCLVAWLYKTTHHTVCRFLRDDTRRKRREQEAITITAMHNDSSPELTSEQIASALDAALQSLGSTDRNALFLRFYSNLSYSELGAKLNVPEDAARMRVNRGLEKLRRSLGRLGVIAAPSGLVSLFEAEAATVAPAGLATTILAAVSHITPAAVSVTASTLFVMTTTKFVTTAVVAITVGTLSVVSYQSWQEIQRLRAEVADLEQKNREAILSRDSEIALVRKRLDDAHARLQVAAPLADLPFENALETWLARVRKVSAYLNKHPEKRIPQMEVLTADNWLDVTKAGNLETDADYRRVVGKLRGTARQKFGPPIGKALVAALAANNAEVPGSPRALIPYLPKDFDLSILDQLEMNPSGAVPHLINPPGRYVLVDKVVDLWDSVMFYDTEGHWGLRSPSSGQERIEDAIEKYKKVTGALPTNASQLTSYNNISALDPSVVAAVFEAINSKPVLE